MSKIETARKIIEDYMDDPIYMIDPDDLNFVLNVLNELSISEREKSTPLDNDSERAEVQAYFHGQAYGWEQGRKALIDELKAEINQLPLVLFLGCDRIEKESVMQILDNIGKAESEDNNGKET